MKFPQIPRPIASHVGEPSSNFRLFKLALSLYFSALFFSAAAISPALAVDGRAPDRLDFGHMQVFSAGIHSFEADHLHPGRPAVVVQDINLIKTLVRQGVPEDQIVALRDEQATTVNSQKQLHALLQKSKRGDFLFVFIHSHGSLNKGGLVCMYETGGVWTFTDLIAEIEQSFKGARACLCVAACHSGSLIDLLKAQPRRIGYFGVTSVVSALSARTDATADFEICIKDAFGGAPCPDLDGDGLVSFDEFGRYLVDDQSRLFHTQPEYGNTSGFDPQMVINQARPKAGAMDCALVQLNNGSRGRIVRQEGDRVLVRGWRNPNAVLWVPSADVSPLP
ncbi:MAG: caspase family protein [Cyanobacteria bacterium REEB67]|nr:caspase family protein [Cyanobacteria bacterium REEB67]